MNTRIAALTLVAVLLAAVAWRGIAARTGHAPGASAAPEATVPPDAGPAPGQPPAAALVFGGALDLNAATADDLIALPGIGPARAARILSLRQERGRFTAVDELLDVAGIGPVTMARLRPLVTVVSPSAAPPGTP